jgi:hypothetical protein
VVIIDTAPILATNDATELIPAADTVVVVARAGKTSADSAKRTRTLLERLGAPVAGVVLIGSGMGESSYSDYYTPQATAAPSRFGIRRQNIKADELGSRIEPWHGVVPGPASPAATTQPAVGHDAVEPSREAHTPRYMDGPAGTGAGRDPSSSARDDD